MTTQKSIPLRRSRGMRDLLPADMRSFRRIEAAFREAAARWGYEEVRTPTLETYSLFTVAGGLTPEALSRVYTFLDWDGWSGERLVVRPDSTIPVARAAAEAGLPLPARLFYVQSRFLFSGAVEAEHWQCGIEFLDAPDTVGDIEIAAVACDALGALGIAPTVRLSHVQATRALGLTAPPAGGEELAEAIPAALREAAAHPSAGAALPRNLLTLARRGAPAAVASLEELAQVAEALESAGWRVIVDLSTPVEFEYYTGVVFELEDGETQLGGGGRYAPSWSGLTHTACGCALSMTPLAALIGELSPPPPPVVVRAGGPQGLAPALALVRELQAAGIVASLGDGRTAERTVLVEDGGLRVTISGEEQVVGSVAELLALLGEGP